MQNKEEFFTESKNRFLKTKFRLDYKRIDSTKYKFLDGIFSVNEFGETKKINENLHIRKYYKMLNRFGFKNPEEYNIEAVYFHKNFGRFIFYNGIKVKHNHSKKVGYIVFWSYGFINESWEENEKPKFFKEDLETGTFTKDIWDVFTFREKRYLLLNCIHYERWYFEVYELTENRARFISEIDYGGL